MGFPARGRNTPVHEPVSRWLAECLALPYTSGLQPLPGRRLKIENKVYKRKRFWLQARTNTRNSITPILTVFQCAAFPKCFLSDSCVWSTDPDAPREIPERPPSCGSPAHGSRRHRGLHVVHQINLRQQPRAGNLSLLRRLGPLLERPIHLAWRPHGQTTTKITLVPVESFPLLSRSKQAAQYQSIASISCLPTASPRYSTMPSPAVNWPYFHTAACLSDHK